MSRSGGLSSPAIPPQAELRLRLEPLSLEPRETEPTRINLLVPNFTTRYLFGGKITIFNFAARLADRGARVRVVATDISDPPDGRSLLLNGSDTHDPEWRRSIEDSIDSEGLFDRIEAVFAGDRGQPLPISPRDRFVATTPYSAHLASDAAALTDERRFLYLIQEYFPILGADDHAAAAISSYTLDHLALYSTELLQEYFEREGIGSFAAGSESESFAFRNAITAVRRPDAKDLSERRSRSLALYARPEQHAARNLFRLALLAIERAIETGGLPVEWRISGIGGVSPCPAVPVGPDRQVEMVERMPQAEYADWLEGHDVALSLMLTPHLSLPPLEFASSGASTVTTVFANKSAEALSGISSNLFGVEPSVEALAGAIGEAVQRRERFEDRAAGAQLDWPTDWKDSLPDDLIDSLMNEIDYSSPL